MSAVGGAKACRPRLKLSEKRSLLLDTILFRKGSLPRNAYWERLPGHLKF